MTEVNAKARGGWVSGSLYGVASWLVPVFLSLVVTPHIVKGLGAEQYGLYALVLGFIGYSFNVNISRALTRRVAEARLSGDEGSVPVMLCTGLVIASVTGLIAVGLTWLLSGVYIESVLDLGSSIFTDQLFVGMMLGSLTIFGLLVGQVFSAVIQGYERLDAFGWISGFASVATICVSLVLVKMGYGFVGLLAGTSVVTLTMAAVSGAVTFRLIGPVAKFRFDSSAAEAIISHSKYVITYQVLSNFVLLFERTVITTQLGAESLSYYVVPMMVGIQFVGFINGLSLFVLPAVSGSRGEDASVRDIYSAVSGVVFVLGALGLISIWVHAGGFLTLWLGADFAVKAEASFRLQMVGLLIVSIATVVFQIAEGLGRPKLNLVATGVICALTVLLIVSPLLGPTIESYALARAIGFALWLPMIPIFEKVLLGSVQFGMWVKIFRSCGPALLVFGAVQVLIRVYFATDWRTLAASLVLGAAGAVGVLFVTGFVGEVRGLVTSRKNGTSETGSSG